MAEKLEEGCDEGQGVEDGDNDGCIEGRRVVVEGYIVRHFDFAQW